MPKDYAALYKDPRWQRKRLLILERDEWACQSCGDTESTLHVHHKYYENGNDPWDYPDAALVTLCAGCHKEEPQELTAALSELRDVARRRMLALDVSLLATAIELMPEELIRPVAACLVGVEEYGSSDEWIEEQLDAVIVWIKANCHA
jgi:hypothetical protein